jgi:hypothetical protein
MTDISVSMFIQYSEWASNKKHCQPKQSELNLELKERSFTKWCGTVKNIWYMLFCDLYQYMSCKNGKIKNNVG